MRSFLGNSSSPQRSSNGRGALFGSVTAFGIAVLVGPGCAAKNDYGASQDAAIVYPDGGRPTEAGGNSDGLADDPCYRCVFEACPAQYAICQQDTECRTIYACAIGQCTDDLPCAQACYSAHATGQPGYDAVSQCDEQAICTTCHAICIRFDYRCQTFGDDSGATEPTSSPSVDSGDAAAPASATACTACSAKKCGAQAQACGAGSACESFSQCVSSCQEAPCFDDCKQRFSAGASASAELSSCVNAGCSAECGLM